LIQAEAIRTCHLTPDRPPFEGHGPWDINPERPGGANMAEIKKVFGIDLGTTYSAVAYIDDFDRAVIVKNDINEPTTPSAVYFESKENTVVGVEAKNMAEIEPENVVQFVKQFMGRKDEFLFEYDGKSYAPEEISALILKGLVDKAQQNLEMKITDVVITVPAYFDDGQRVATRNAGIMAGLNVLDIVNEPIAAALAYGMQAGGQAKDEVILVYDLGGGTFDVSVINVDKEGVKILVTGGKHDLGGKNWDDRLITYLASKFEEENGVNPLTDPFAHQELRTKGEIAKKTLSVRTKVPFTFAFAGFKWRLELEREKFEEITADLMDLTIKVTHETLDELQAKTGQRHIDRFFLVGGSSRMPMVKERVDKEFGTNSETYDPDECVAKGAAIWAVKRKIEGLAEQVGYNPQTGEGNQAAFKKALDKEIQTVRNKDYYLALPGKSGGNVSSHTYGLLAYDGETPLVVPLLTKNTEIPFTYESGDRQFGTAVANQATIELVLMEADGDSLDPALCKEIGRGTVELPRGVPKGSEVKIWFNYLDNGTMSLKAQEVSTNRECEVKLTRVGVMDAEEVEQAGDRLSILNAR
jgi:molecular chaperone DnaK (HSP70)